jgi:phage baseplate assembly protein W
MARIIQNRFPIDSKKRKKVGFSIPINGSAVFIPTYTTRDQIKSNLINYLLTNKGERVFNPNFGADLRSILFQQVNDVTVEELRIRIQTSITTNFPRVSVKKLKFHKSPDDNSINLILTYDVDNFGITDEVNIILQ